MKVAVDPMARIAGNDVNLALAFDYGVFAGWDRKPRLFDPLPRIGGFGRNAAHIALLLDDRRNGGDRAIV